MSLPVSAPRSPSARWAAFYTIGGLGMGIQLATVWLLTAWVGLDYLVSTALGVEISILHNFVWHERWTWADRTVPAGDLATPAGIPPALRRLGRFNLANGLVSIWGNVAFTGLFVSVFASGYLVGNVLAIAACSVLNFMAADRLVFQTEA